MVRVARALGLAVAPWVLFACVSIDNRASAEHVEVEATRHLHGRFSTWPNYPRDSAYTLENILSYSGSRADTANVDLEGDRVLTIRFDKEGTTLYTKRYSFADGLRLSPDGKITLPPQGECQGGRDSPTIGGCFRNTVSFFVNSKGELVAEFSNRAIGTLGIVPYGQYIDAVAIFPPISIPFNESEQLVRRAVREALPGDWVMEAGEVIEIPYGHHLCDPDYSGPRGTHIVLTGQRGPIRHPMNSTFSRSNSG